MVYSEYSNNSNKEDYKCPKCRSNRVIIQRGIVQCLNCKYQEDLIDFPINNGWDKIYKSRSN
jgi:ribosomal protein L37AE/L43A